MSRTSPNESVRVGIVMQRAQGCELFATASSFLDLVKVRDDFLAPLSRKDNVRGRDESFYIRGAAGVDGRAGGGPIPRNLGIVACG
jgi:hypothetical protein